MNTGHAGTSLEYWRTELAAHWDISTPLVALDGEFDLNFASDDRVFKIMRPDCNATLVQLQVACLEHLGDATPAIPKVAPTREQARIVTVVDTDGNERLAWSISRLPGELLAHTSPHDEQLVRQIGRHIGELHEALESFQHPGLTRTLKWDLRRASEVFAGAAQTLSGHPLKAAIERVFDEHGASALSALENLPAQAIHNDLNDHNLLVETPSCGTPQLTGIIDFGDMLSAPPVCDLAIAGAYLMLNKPRPFDSLAALVHGYCQVRQLDQTSLALIWPLALIRLAVSAIHATTALASGDDDPYLQVSQAPLQVFLAERLDTDATYVNALICRAAGRAPTGLETIRWINDPARRFMPVFDADLTTAPILDLSVTGDDASDNPVQPAMRDIEHAVANASGNGTRAVIGRYSEARLVYGAPFYLAGEHQASDRRTIHIAIDVFLPEGTLVHAPLAGTVHSTEVCDQAYDYGGLIVLRHEPEPGSVFYTLYGHLTHESARQLTHGQAVAAGEAFARLGHAGENGGWPPHVHFQLGLTGKPGSAWPGVVDPDQLADWQAVFPDPAPLLGLPVGHATATPMPVADTRTKRFGHAPNSLRTSYRTPLHLVRGWQSLVFDDRGRTYLDAYNNVPHVGHSHPRISRAINRQLRLLNTNTRYLQTVHSNYIEALAARMPEPLSVVFLLSSGSEANELALRLARTHTRERDAIVMAAGYHGHTVATVELSDYKFSGPGGDGKVDWVHVVNNPDTFRGSCRDPQAAGAHYAAEVASVIDSLQQTGRQPACFIAETFPSVGGQLVPPPHYLQQVYAHVRGAGGVCIADEVQTGLGRLGHYFWGFEQQQVTPDIVVLGKPLGNGYPLAAVVTTADIAASFDTGMEFFATFGGASVACAAGHEVLRIIDDEQLAARSATVGDHLLAGLRQLATHYPMLADVRGCGLFIGVEIADADRQPLAAQTDYIVNRLRDRRVLIGSDGPHHNVLKIRPPLTFSVEDTDYLLMHLEAVLSENALREY